MYSSLKSVELLKQRIYWMHSSPIYQILQRSGRDQLPCAFVQCRAGPCRLPSQPAMMQWYEYHPSAEGVAAARLSCLDASKFVDFGKTASWNLPDSWANHCLARGQPFGRVEWLAQPAPPPGVFWNFLEGLTFRILREVLPTPLQSELSMLQSPPFLHHASQCLVNYQHCATGVFLSHSVLVVRSF